jgi:hypothetical protein
MAKEFDVGKYVASRREIIGFECPLSEALRVVESVLVDPAYRRLRIDFVGYDDSKAPLVSVEVEFAVPLGR